jgi:hypothetical protein
VHVNAKTCWVRRAIVAVVAVVSVTKPCSALASLSGTLHRFVENHAALLRNSVFDTLTPVLERVAVRGADLPPTASSLGFSYRYDLETGAYVRDTGPLGSAYVERPRTVPAGSFVAGAFYQHADLTRFDGDDLAEQVTLRSRTEFGPGDETRRTLQFTDLDIKTDVLSLFATYGLRENWDVNLLVPLSFTSLTLSADQTTINRRPGEPAVSHPRTLHTADSSFGLGDILLRSKIWSSFGPVDAAISLGVRAPTGNAADFQGLEDWRIEPDLLIAHDRGGHEVHGAVGLEINADVLERTRVRYAVGGSVQPLAGLAFYFDTIGSSAVATETFTVASGGDAFVTSAFLDQFQTSAPRTVGGQFVVDARLPRTDLVDLDIGIKWSPVAQLLLFADVLVPLTSDGLRSQFIPSVGVQYTR